MADNGWERFLNSLEDYRTIILAQDEYLTKLLDLQENIRIKYEPQLKGGQPATWQERDAIDNKLSELTKLNDTAKKGLYYH